MTIHCRWCGKAIAEKYEIISAYGYKVCSEECAEGVDMEEHSYLKYYDPDNMIDRREP